MVSKDVETLDIETSAIIGREFDFFKFKSVNMLNWDNKHDKFIGSNAKILSAHSQHKQFVLTEVYPTNGKKFTKHFPVQLLIDKFKEEDNLTVDDLLNKIKQLTSRI